MQCSDVSVWVMMAVACVGDGGSLGGCVWVRVEERMADRACLLVGCMFDLIYLHPVSF